MSLCVGKLYISCVYNTVFHLLEPCSSTSSNHGLNTLSSNYRIITQKKKNSILHKKFLNHYTNIKYISYDTTSYFPKLNKFQSTIAKVEMQLTVRHITLPIQIYR
jgi:hypothetical protein